MSLERQSLRRGAAQGRPKGLRYVVSKAALAARPPLDQHRVEVDEDQLVALIEDARFEHDRPLRRTEFSPIHYALDDVNGVANKHWRHEAQLVDARERDERVLEKIGACGEPDRHAEHERAV